MTKSCSYQLGSTVVCTIFRIKWRGIHKRWVFFYSNIKLVFAGRAVYDEVMFYGQISLDSANYRYSLLLSNLRLETDSKDLVAAQLISQFDGVPSYLHSVLSVKNCNIILIAKVLFLYI